MFARPDDMPLSGDPDRDEQFQSWIRQARAGDSEALGAMVEACQTYLLAIAKRTIPETLRSKCDPHDLVQETALAAHRDFAAFAGEHRLALLLWLRRILLNRASNATRQFKQTEKRLIRREVPVEMLRAIAEELVDQAPTPLARVLHAEQIERVRQCLKRLPDHMKQVIVLRIHERQTFPHIGLVMGRSADAARKLWARAMQRLEVELRSGSGGE
jgi:RNA polymerase sigma-70 factor (ECF subfamily)